MKKKDNNVELRKVMIPIIRRVMPEMIASEIVGVQPMDSTAYEQIMLQSAIKIIEKERAEKISKRRKPDS